MHALRRPSPHEPRPQAQARGRLCRGRDQLDRNAVHRPLLREAADAMEARIRPRVLPDAELRLADQEAALAADPLLGPHLAVPVARRLDQLLNRLRHEAVLWADAIRDLGRIGADAILDAAAAGTKEGAGVRRL